MSIEDGLLFLSTRHVFMNTTFHLHYMLRHMQSCPANPRDVGRCHGRRQPLYILRARPLQVRLHYWLWFPGYLDAHPDL